MGEVGEGRRTREREMGCEVKTVPRMMSIRTCVKAVGEKNLRRWRDLHLPLNLGRCQERGCQIG